ncbi:MAG TPA: flagellar biosynthesis anti-sigma factor FlgM [Solirubrobacteraceae bacterium]
MLDLDNLIAIHDATDPDEGISPELAIARAHRPQVRRARVHRLGELIAEGRYEVDSALVADALVARLRAIRSTS